MLKTRQRPKATRSSYRLLSRTSSFIVPRRPYPAPAIKSWNRMIILFYSSIISTAAAADVSVKKRRREQWDKAIAEVESSLGAFHEPSSNSGSLPAVSVTQDEVERKFTGRAKESYSLQLRQIPPIGVDRAEQTLGSRPMMEALSNMLDRPRILTAKVQEMAKVSPTSVYASNTRRKRKLDPWTPKKLVTTEYSVAKLATRLLIEAQRESSGNLRQIEDLEKTLKDITLRLLVIPDVDTYDLGGLQRLQYPQFNLDVEPTADDATPLNKALTSAIRSYALGDISYGMALRKIAYRLLVSPVPPDRITYSLLISRFRRIGRLRLAKFVIGSMIESHVRPDEMSAAAILSCYIQARDHRKFDDFVRRIQGLNGGLMLAQPNVWTGVGSSRLHRHEDKVIQAMDVNATMAYLIIRGYLMFEEENLAMEWYVRMQEQGIRPTSEILNCFLWHYACHGQWESGMAVWEQMHARRFLSPTSEHFTIEDENRAFSSALKLCKNCGKTKEFSVIYKEGLLRGISMDKLFRPMRKRQGFSFLDDLAQKRRRAILALEHRVAMMIDDNLSWALHALVSKMLLLNFSISDVEAIFRHFGAKDSYIEWLNSRPWLWRRKWSRVLPSTGIAQSAIS